MENQERKIKLNKKKVIKDHCITKTAHVNNRLAVYQKKKFFSNTVSTDEGLLRFIQAVWNEFICSVEFLLYPIGKLLRQFYIGLHGVQII